MIIVLSQVVFWDYEFELIGNSMLELLTIDIYQEFHEGSAMKSLVRDTLRSEDNHDD